MCLHLRLTALTEQLICMNRWRISVDKSLTSMTAIQTEFSRIRRNITQRTHFFFNILREK